MNGAVNRSHALFKIRSLYIFPLHVNGLKRMFHKDYLSIVPYEVPKWAENLKCRPDKRVLVSFFLFILYYLFHIDLNDTDFRLLGYP